MDMMDRLLRHDTWTTRKLMELSMPLSDVQLDQVFPVGHGTLRKTFSHIVNNAEVWAELIMGEDKFSFAPPANASMSLLIERYERASEKLYNLARHLTDEGRLDETFVDKLDNPPRRKTNGAGILHVATHGMHHRCQILYMLRELEIDGVPEGDAVSWEKQHLGGWQEA